MFSKVLRNRLQSRYFSTTTLHYSQMIDTQYMINCARVCIRMPSFGDMWFFIDEKTTVQDLSTLCKREDALVSTIEILKEGGAVQITDNLYNLLQAR